MVETRTADNVRQARARLAIWDAILAEAEGLYEISAKDFPPIRWLVKDLLPEGTFCLLSGRGKMGKTWLALQLASAVFLGLPFLGNGDRPCGRSGVLFLSLQLSSRQIHDRLEAAGILADNRVQVIHR
jgi:RecA-family ATPase